MENHPIPQDVTGFQFKLVGNMTVKQFAFVATGVILAVVIFYSPLFFILKVPFIVLFAGAGLLLAFVPVEGRPMDSMLSYFLKALFSPNQYIYAKTGVHFTMDDVHASPKKIKAHQGQVAVPHPRANEKEQQLATLLQSIRPQQQTPLDARESTFLQKFYTPSTGTPIPAPSPTPQLSPVPSNNNFLDTFLKPRQDQTTVNNPTPVRAPHLITEEVAASSAPHAVIAQPTQPVQTIDPEEAARAALQSKGMQQLNQEIATQQAKATTPPPPPFNQMIPPPQQHTAPIIPPPQIISQQISDPFLEQQKKDQEVAEKRRQRELEQKAREEEEKKKELQKQQEEEARIKAAEAKEAEEKERALRAKQKEEQDNQAREARKQALEIQAQIENFAQQKENLLKEIERLQREAEMRKQKVVVPTMSQMASIIPAPIQPAVDIKQKQEEERQKAESERRAVEMQRQLEAVAKQKEQEAKQKEEAEKKAKEMQEKLETIARQKEEEAKQKAEAEQKAKEMQEQLAAAAKQKEEEARLKTESERKEKEMQEQLAAIAKEKEAEMIRKVEAERKAKEVEEQLKIIAEQKEQLQKEIERLQKEGVSQKTEDVVVPTVAPTPVKTTSPLVRAIPKPQASQVGVRQPEAPNLILGIIKDPRGNILPNILVEIKDKEGNSVRAFKTNALGQFATATPLQNGVYTLTFEDLRKQHNFTAVEVTADGSLIPSLEIISEDARESLRKELFA